MCGAARSKTCGGVEGNLPRYHVVQASPCVGEPVAPITCISLTFKLFVSFSDCAVTKLLSIAYFPLSLAERRPMSLSPMLLLGPKSSAPHAKPKKGICNQSTNSPQERGKDISILSFQGFLPPRFSQLYSYITLNFQLQIKFRRTSVSGYANIKHASMHAKLPTLWFIRDIINIWLSTISAIDPTLQSF